MFPNTVTGAPVVGSPSTSSPLVTLKHGSNLVKPKQEIIQKKEEEVNTGFLFKKGFILFLPRTTSI